MLNPRVTRGAHIAAYQLGSELFIINIQSDQNWLPNIGSQFFCVDRNYSIELVNTKLEHSDTVAIIKIDFHRINKLKS